MGKLKPLIDALKDSGDSLATHGRRLVDLPGNHKTKIDDVRQKTNDTDRAGASKAEADASSTGGGSDAPRHEHGVRFFGEEQLKYYTGDYNLGQEGRAVFMMPAEDAAKITNVYEAAMESGLAPSITDAAMDGTRAFGAVIPVGGMDQRLPTFADAEGWPHFHPGGHTAMNVDGTIFPNETREFVVDGGSPLPEGTIVFELLDGGEINTMWVVGSGA